MTILDYAKKEIKNLKGKPPQERWEYFLDYYKWHAVVVLVVLLLIVQGIITVATHKDTVFHIALLNADLGVDGSVLAEHFEEYAGITDKKEQAVFNTGLILSKEPSPENTAAFQQLMASLAVKEIDCVAGPPEPFELCAYSAGSPLADLRDYLDDATLEKFADRLYYIDATIVEQIQNAAGTSFGTIKYPDPRKPETMKKPIPVGIDISDRALLKNTCYASQKTVYLGITINTTHPETALAFIDYLWS